MEKQFFFLWLNYNRKRHSLYEFGMAENVRLIVRSIFAVSTRQTVAKKSCLLYGYLDQIIRVFDFQKKNLILYTLRADVCRLQIMPLAGVCSILFSRFCKSSDKVKPQNVSSTNIEPVWIQCKFAVFEFVHQKC